MMALAAAVGIITGDPAGAAITGESPRCMRDAGRSGTAGIAGKCAACLHCTDRVRLRALIGAGLLLASFRAVLAINAGFEPAGVLTASMTLPA